ncbi:MAG TPA: penicillin-binding transpeptidase domain-containing protein [Pyrinomonadaceae bacterium]
MKFMSPARLSRLLLPAIFLLLAFTFPAFSRPHPKPTPKKAARAVKVARKEVKNDRSASRNRRESRSDRAKDSRRDKKISPREQRRLDALAKRDAKSSKKSRADLRREAAERRRIEEERRRAALAEQRRREEAARQARLRQIAFENGLKQETQADIAKDDTDGEDAQVRAAAVNALGNKAGTVVVMEAQTGKIVTIVNQDWAIKNSFKPCSTIKLVTGVAGLTEHVINTEGGIGSSTSGVSLDGAIAHSNNGYFQRVGSNLGSTKMVSYARQLGLGEPTGINVDGETGGRVPNGNNNLRIYSHGDDFEVTPLQLAVLTSAIAEGGKRVVPQVAKTRFEGTSFRVKYQRPIGVPTGDLDQMLPGMIGTAEYGTAHRGVDASLGIAGKTGSCIYKGTWIGLFTSVAPVENPKYAVVVITRGSGERGKYAAAIAGRVYQALSPRIRPARNLTLAASRFGNRPSIQKNMAAADDEDDDDDAATTDDASATNAEKADNAAQQVPQYRPAPTATQPAQKPLVTRTVQSTPKFAPVIIQYDKSGAEKSDRSTKPDPSTATRPRVIKNN